MSENIESESNHQDEVAELGDEGLKDISVDKVDESKDSPQSLRIMIKELPKRMTCPDLKKLIHKTMPSIEFRKLKINDGNAFLSFTTEDDVLAALKTFEGMEIKGKLLKTKRVAEEPLSRQRMQARSPQPIRTAKEIATPLAHLSYDEQLKQKQEASFKIALNIKKQAIQAGIQLWLLQ
ncbi:hypothetical protein FO519_006871 [Halicephalobus sp. NKZ332]|nr:hypothetical protein FO519_006871 [Halicephalobus sp. NKZ332]